MYQKKRIGTVEVDIMLKPNLEGGFTVECVDLDVVSEGETKEQALHNIEEAVSLHFEVAQSEGIISHLLKRLERKAKPEIKEIQVALPVPA